MRGWKELRIAINGILSRVSECVPSPSPETTGQRFILLIAVSLLAGIPSTIGCSDTTPVHNENIEIQSSQKAGEYHGKKTKVLYVDSYHAEYVPSVIMQKAAREIFDPAGIVMEVVYLDAKRAKSEKDLQEAALKAHQKIQEWEPDLAIAADDAASKYLVRPYYGNSDLPIVFIGVNWDPSPYGYPCRNVTGQVEVELVEELIAELGKYARGSRTGILTGDTLTDRKNLQYYQDVLGIKFDKIEFVNTLDEWKDAYLSFQDGVDILIFRNNSGIAGWDDRESEAFVLQHTEIPSGTVSTHLGRWVLISYAKVNKEFGEYAARTALKILEGTSPADIPLTTNHQAKIYLHMGLAKKLGIRLPMELIERATFVEEFSP